MDHINNCLLSGPGLPPSPPPAPTAVVVGPLGAQPPRLSLPLPLVVLGGQGTGWSLAPFLCLLVELSFFLAWLAVNHSFPQFNENQVPRRRVAQGGSRAAAGRGGPKIWAHLWSTALTPPPSSGPTLCAGASHTRLTTGCSGVFGHLSLGLALLPGETLQGTNCKELRKLRVS